MKPISLNSNLSYESIQLTPTSIGDTHGEFELAIYAQHWDGDHEHAVRLTSESIVLSTDQLQALCNRIQTWANSDDAGRNSFVGDFDLADGNSNAQLALRFEERCDIISSDDKSVVTANYRIGRMIGEFSFVTDQSCLSSFAGDIARTFAQIAG